jgi:hypothetical protein
MNPNPAWPSNAAEIVLWAELLAVWTIASYVTAPRVRRDDEPGSGATSVASLIAPIIVGAGGWLLPPLGSSTWVRVALSTGLVVAMGANILVRRGIGAGPLRRYLAEWEISVNVVIGIATGATIGFAQIGAPSDGTFVRSGKVAAAVCVIAAVAFVFRGGTYIVRSVLDRTNAMPRLSTSPAPGASRPTPDIPELNRGRAIGNIERLLMLMVISLGSYEALGFLVAAKGLIRAREFEDRDFAEYFILGSLTSVAVALAAGVLLHVALRYLWTVE